MKIFTAERKNIKKSAVVLVLVMLLVSLVFSGCDLGSLQKRVVEPSGSVASAEYSAVFEGTGIVHVSDVAGVDTVSYAMKDEDDFVYCQDYAYKGDTITEWTITNYIPIHGFDDELMAEMEAACQTDLEPYEPYDCAQASYTVGVDYITFKVKFTNVDDKDTLQALKELEFLDSVDGYFSMQECEKVDMNDGYVKK